MGFPLAFIGYYGNRCVSHVEGRDDIFRYFDYRTLPFRRAAFRFIWIAYQFKFLSIDVLPVCRAHDDIFSYVESQTLPFCRATFHGMLVCLISYFDPYHRCLSFIKARDYIFHSFDYGILPFHWATFWFMLAASRFMLVAFRLMWDAFRFMFLPIDAFLMLKLVMIFFVILIIGLYPIVGLLFSLCWLLLSAAIAIDAFLMWKLVRIFFVVLLIGLYPFVGLLFGLCWLLFNLCSFR